MLSVVGMPKGYFTVYAESDVLDALRDKAVEYQVPQGDLLALCLRYAFERINPEAIREWAARRLAPVSPSDRPLSTDEGRVLRGFAQLMREWAPRWRFTPGELQGVCGRPVREIYRATVALRERGWANLEALTEETDRWGRPARWTVTLTDAGLAKAGAPDAAERKTLAAARAEREAQTAAFDAKMRAARLEREARAASLAELKRRAPPPPPPSE